MPKTKFGVGKDVKTESGFAPYEGPLPKPGTIYPVEQKQASLKRAKSGTVYINSLWEVTSGECKGFSSWHRVVPGDHEIQQVRVAQYMQACTGKNEADILFEADAADEEVGKITKIGGRKPQGVKSRASFQRKRDTYNVAEGEEAPWTAEISDLIVGGAPKSDEAEDLEEEEEDDLPADEDLEDEEDAEEEGDSEEEEDEDEDDESEEEEGEYGATFAEAGAMSLVQLKKLATEWESELDLASYKGPKGKKKLIADLVDEEIVEAEGGAEDDEPPF